MAITLGHRWPTRSNLQQSNGFDALRLILRRTSKPGGATPTLQRNAAYFCLSFARLSLAWLFALGRVLTWLDFKFKRQQILWKCNPNLPNMCFRLSIWLNGHRESQKYEFVKWVPRTNEAAGLIVMSPNSSQMRAWFCFALLIWSRKNMN
jgi:hypothetical protein